jgi:hypothetical protein
VKHPAKAIFGLLLLAAAAMACSPAALPITSPVGATGSPSPLSSVLAATGAPATSATTAATTAKSTVGPPAAPTGVSMTSLTPPATCPAAFGSSCFKYKVDWSEAGPSGVTIDILAVTKCLDHPDCVLPTTTIPATNLVLLTSAAASKKTTTFMLGDGESNGAGWLPGSGGKTVYVYGVVVRARNAMGKSGLVVAWAW